MSLSFINSLRDGIVMRRRVSKPDPATMHEIVNLTARHIGPKAKGYSAHSFGKGIINKDWMHPKVRNVLDAYSRRHLFSNPLCSRVMFETFVMDAGTICFDRRKPKSQIDDEMKRSLVKFTSRLKFPGEVSAGQRFKLVRISLEILQRKLNEFHAMGNKDWSEIKVEPDKKRGVHVEDSKYYSENARDAIGHIVGAQIMTIDDAVNHLIKAAKSMEDTFNR
jgi:hypothetical protein